MRFLTPAEYEFLDALAVENQNIVRGPCLVAVLSLGFNITTLIPVLVALQDEWANDPNRDQWEWMQRQPGAAPPCPWNTHEEVLARIAEFESYKDTGKSSDTNKRPNSC